MSVLCQCVDNESAVSIGTVSAVLVYGQCVLCQCVDSQMRRNRFLFPANQRSTILVSIAVFVTAMDCPPVL